MENLSFVPSVDLPVTSTATISNTTVTRTGCIFAIFICTFDNEIQHYIRLKENNSASNNKRARNSTAGFSSSIYRVQFQEETRRHKKRTVTNKIYSPGKLSNSCVYSNPAGMSSGRSSRSRSTELANQITRTERTKDVIKWLGRSEWLVKCYQLHAWWWDYTNWFYRRK